MPHFDTKIIFINFDEKYLSMKISLSTLTAENAGRFISLYELSFPVDERRLYESPEHFLAFLKSREGKFCAYEIMDGGSFAGFITSWEFEGYVYVEHFAVDGSMRGSGIGSEAFSLLLEKAAQKGKPLILEVEMPEDELSRRRIGFYERLGGKLRTDFEYVQPPYRKDSSPLPMRIMTWGEIELGPDTLRPMLRDVYGVD